jgi:hypothetical protein
MPPEIGGEYQLYDFPGDGLDAWPARRSFFASGRAALYALCRRWIETHSHARLWLPDYFCSEVVSSLRSRNIPVAFYSDDPQQTGPELSHLRVSPGDILLAVNYFGIRSGDQWSAWRESTQSVALIEDHTHDPQSLWARSSKADFAFASLRKTLPLPDGAIAWSPRGLSVPEAAPGSAPLGSSLKLAAMLYKRRYLESGETCPSLKRTFLELQKQGEQILPEPSNEAMSAWSLDVVCRGTPSLWRRRRERNVRSLLAQAPSVDVGKPLFISWPAGHCPFNVVYVFEDEAARDRVRSRLIAAQVYTPVHWPLQDGGKASINLSKRLLTIPVDFRCDDQQIQRIASLLMGRESAGRVRDP